MQPLESYLRDLHDTRSTGAAVKETSYYPPLANLLDAVGERLKPRPLRHQLEEPGRRHIRRRIVRAAGIGPDV